MSLDPEATYCGAVIEHTDTVWKRCPKASECARYTRRKERGPLAAFVPRYCRLREYEHFVQDDDA